jgi:predicted enzyme related to lactoylglutathione lyase
MLTTLILLASAALAAPLDDLAWMAGTWRGVQGAHTVEEHWSEPVGDSMVGSFRMVAKDQPVFYELIVIELEGDTPVMRLKHFDPGLSGWEKRKQALSFTLQERGEDHALFVDEEHGKSLRYARTGDALTIELVHEEGTSHFELVRWPAVDAEPTEPDEGPPLLGLRTLGLEVADPEAAKEFFSRALGIQPYFDQPFYVGFDLYGFELGLTPVEGEPTLGSGGVCYWRVADIEAVRDRLIAAGATEQQPITDVGGGVRVAQILTPQGSLLGLIQEPTAD